MYVRYFFYDTSHRSEKKKKRFFPFSKRKKCVRQNIDSKNETEPKGTRRVKDSHNQRIHVKHFLEQIAQLKKEFKIMSESFSDPLNEMFYNYRD